MLAFNAIEKYDAHMHYCSKREALLEQGESDRFSFLTINLDAPDALGISFQEQEEIALYHDHSRLRYIATFPVNGLEDPGWPEAIILGIKKSVENGAVAVKVWKNIGMDIRDRDGRFVMIDNPIFDMVFDYLAQLNIPLLGHLGEPKNCWLPLEEMTINSDRAYYKSHPEYHMYLHPEYPTYEEQMEARDHMLDKHPNLRFIGAHIASLEWDTNEMAKRFDKFPNMAIDLAERICHLQLQAKRNRQKVYDFMVKYQDRIIYGTDVVEDNSKSVIDIKKHVHNIWLRDWEFFTTDKLMESPEFEGKFRGLNLPDGVVEKIYRLNTEKWYFQNGRCNDPQDQ